MAEGAIAAKPPPHPPLREQPALLRRLFSDPSPVLDELTVRYGPMYSMGRGPVRMAVIGDPVALRELHGMPTDSFRWGHKFNVLGFVVGPIVAALFVTVWDIYGSAFADVLPQVGALDSERRDRSP